MNADLVFELLMEGYALGDYHSPDWDSRAEELFQGFSKHYVSSFDHPDSPTLLYQCRDLMKDECKDPTIRFCDAYLRDYRRLKDITGPVLHTLDAMRGIDDYPVLLESMFVMLFMRTNARDMSDDLMPRMYEELGKKAFLDILERVVSDPSFQKLHPRLQYYHLSGYLIKDYPFDWLETCGDFFETHESIDEWARQMLLASVASKIGWKHRGGGFANTVADEAWLELDEYLLQTASHLERAMEIQPHWPDAAGDMINLKLVLPEFGEISAREWFERSLEMDPTYYYSYSAYSNWLNPKWYGTFTEYIDFLNECVDDPDDGVHNPMRYIFGIQSIRRGALWAEDPEYASRAFEILDDFLDSAEHENQTRRLWTYKVLIAWRAGDMELASKWEREINGDLFIDPFRNFYRARVNFLKELKQYRTTAPY